MLTIPPITIFIGGIRLLFPVAGKNGIGLPTLQEIPRPNDVLMEILSNF